MEKVRHESRALRQERDILKYEQKIQFDPLKFIPENDNEGSPVTDMF